MLPGPVAVEGSVRALANYLRELHDDPLPWLLERDEERPAVRYFALRWLLGQNEADSEVRAARADVMRSGPVPEILAAQLPEGEWPPAGRLFASTYTTTGWQLIFLSGLGAEPSDMRVQRAGERVLDLASVSSGGLSWDGRQSGVVHCYNGDLLRALIDFGWLDDARVQAAVEWTARAVLGTGDPQYRRSGTNGPLFACSHNGKRSCAWGAVKGLRALAAIPGRRRTRAVREAIDASVALLLDHDLALADFPTATSMSGRWFRFGFPASYSADILELLLALAELGRARDPRAASGIELLLSKQDAGGRWPLETTLNGKMLTNIERKGEPSKWVTLRALRVLKAAS
jgi:hypothetical protein